MKKNNILDIGISTVRTSGKTNMLDIKTIQYYAFHMGFFELVSFIEEEKNNVISYMNTIDFESCPVADHEYLSDLNDNLSAREELREDFSDEMQDYKNNWLKFEPLPFSVAHFSVKDLLKMIHENPDLKHPYTYMFSLGKYNIIWFSNGIYALNNGEAIKIDFKLFKELQREINGRGYGRFIKARFAHLEEEFRLKDVLAK